MHLCWGGTNLKVVFVKGRKWKNNLKMIFRDMDL
jgi:hypothetical protein